MSDRIMGELKKVFRLELLNRIDEVIVFHKLTRDEILEIVDLMMRRVREQISTHEVVIELSDAAKELLVEKGYDPTMGACRCAARSSATSRTRSPTSCSAPTRARRSIVVDRKDEEEA